MIDIVMFLCSYFFFFDFLQKQLTVSNHYENEHVVHKEILF